LFNGDEQVIALLDSEMESSSDIIPLNLKKDGTPGRGSGTCSEEQLQLMRRFLHHKLYKIGSNIMTGHIEKSPYRRSSQEDGCMYCPYKGACGFDEKQYGYKKRQIASLSGEEVWEKMTQELTGENDKE